MKNNGNCKYQPKKVEDVNREFCRECQKMAPDGCRRIGCDNFVEVFR